MADLLHAQERDRLLLSLRRMLRPAILDGQRVTGLARGAGAATLLHTADNAAGAELMALPALRAANPEMADGLFAFLAVLNAAGGPPARAVAPPGTPRVEILGADPRNLRVITPWHEFTGDLSRGVLRQRLRGEGREADVTHSGNMARMRLRGGVPGLLGRLSLRLRTLDVEDAITAQGVEAEGAAVLMWHESTLRLRPLPGLTVTAGTLRYAYRVSAVDPLLRLTVTLRAAPRSGLTAVRLSTAVDGLSEGIAPPAHLTALRHDVPVPRPPGPFADQETLATGAIDSLHLWQDGPEEDALALHILPPTEAPLQDARMTARGGVPHWLVLRHALPDLPRGGTATLRERRLLARGVAPGMPSAAPRLMQDRTDFAGRDPGLTGVGASIAAIAAILLHAPACVPPLPGATLRRLQDALDRQLQALPDLREAALPVSELAAIAMGLDSVLRAGGPAREERRLRDALGRIVAAASPTGAMDATLGGHGAALLALARAATLLPDPALDEAICRGVAAIEPQGPNLAGTSPRASPDTRSLAILLRATRMVETAGRSGQTALDAATLARAADVTETCLLLLSARLRPAENRLDVLSGEKGEAEPGGTAALLLALLPTDEAAMTAGRIAA